jgi:ribosome-associated protein
MPEKSTRGRAKAPVSLPGGSTVGPADDATADTVATPVDAANVDAAAAANAPSPVANRPGLPARTTPPPPAERPPLEAARRVVELAEDKKAADIVLLEIAPLTTVADYLVICSGGSERQLGAIADGIVEGLKHDGFPILGREGEPDSHWILVDAAAVIVHVFAPPERNFYGLEKLWPEAKTILRVQ